MFWEFCMAVYMLRAAYMFKRDWRGSPVDWSLLAPCWLYTKQKVDAKADFSIA